MASPSTVATILERKRSAATLVCLLQGCERQTVTVELRDETAIHGVMNNVDSCMNIEMTGATVYWRHRNRVPTRFDQFFISGSHIRFVHLPAYTDCIGVLQRRIKQLTGIRRGARTDRQPHGRTRPIQLSQPSTSTTPPSTAS